MVPSSELKFQAYLLTCAVSGKRYVGVTSRTLRQRWNEHRYDARKRPRANALSRAIEKHGAENFTIEALCSARTWEDICAVEALLIGQHGTLKPGGYNLTLGGEGRYGYRPSAESVERSAAKHRGRACHPNTLAAAHARKGQKKPEGHGAKVAAALKGISRSEATKEKLRAYWAKRRAEGAFKTPAPYAHARRVAA